MVNFCFNPPLYACSVPKITHPSNVNEDVKLFLGKVSWESKSSFRASPPCMLSWYGQKKQVFFMLSVSLVKVNQLNNLVNFSICR